MTIKKLVSLSKMDFAATPTKWLILMDQRWKSSRKLKQSPTKMAVTLHFLRCIIGCFMIAGVIFVVLGSSAPNFSTTSTLGPVAFVLGLVMFMADTAFFIRNEKNHLEAKKFCKAITMLESSVGKLSPVTGKGTWMLVCSPALWHLHPYAIQALQPQVEKVKLSEPKQWEEKATSKLRSELERDILTMHHLVGSTTNSSTYFQNSIY